MEIGSACHTADDDTSPGAMTMTTTTVASRLASICEMIDDLSADTNLSARRVAAISAMIEELAVGRTRRTTRKRRMANSRCYEQVRTLGGGTFGVVVKARHRATGQTVAVKTLRDSPTQETVGELLREACFMAACSGHPSLVALRGVVRTPGTTKGRRDYFLVMEYVGRRNLHQALRQRIRRTGMPFPEADVRCIVRQLLAGADTIHGNGVVHRDIKPQNILVVQDGGGTVVKIADYGLALSTDEEEEAAAGTLCFMAPEVLVEKPDRDTRVDLWSIGCVMAELLTGKTLFKAKGDDKADQLYKIFDVLGVPGERASGTAFNWAIVGAWRARQRFAAGPRNRLRKLFPKALLSKEGFQVLQGLLTCNPRRRLDAAAALRLPWFADTGVMPAADVPRSRG